MSFFRLPVWICTLVFLLAVTALAADDTASTATPVNPTETVNNTVSPSDVFDFFTFDVTASSPLTGTITMDSPQVGTTIKITDGAGKVLFDKSTSNNTKIQVYTLPAEGLSAGKYYIRMGFYSSYAFDHDYTLTLNLAPVASSSDWPTPMELNYGVKVSDTVNDTNHLDIWHLTVAEIRIQGSAIACLTSTPEELVFYLYDSSENEIVNKTTSGGSLIYRFDSGGTPLEVGDYYIGVLLPLKKKTETSYTLELKAPGSIQSVELADTLPPKTVLDNQAMGTMRFDIADLSLKGEAKSPWPLRRANPQNTGQSRYNGPPSKLKVLASVDLFTELGLKVPSMPAVPMISGLTVGAGGRIYFMHYQTAMLYCYDLLGKQQFHIQTAAGAIGPVLDEDGNLYILNADKVHLTVLKPDGSELYSWVIPGGNPSNRNLWMVGKWVYISTYSFTDKRSILYTCSKDGSTVLTYPPQQGKGVTANPPIEGWVERVAEDPQGKYVAALAGDTLYCISTGVNNQNILWYKTYTQKDEYPGYPSVISDNKGPIIMSYGGPYYTGAPPADDRDNIFYNNVFKSFYRIIRDDDTMEVLSNEYNCSSTNTYALSHPYAVCLDRGFSIYAVDYLNQVSLFSTAAYKSQTWQIPGKDITVHDMVMGEDETMYVNYVATTGTNPPGSYIATISGPDNSLPNQKIGLLNIQELQVPDDCLIYPVQLAIAGQNKLAYLSSRGYLIIFGAG